MKNRTLIAASIVAVVLAVAAPLAFAQHRVHQHDALGFGGDAMALGHLKHAQTALGLSDDQVAQIKQIFADLKTQNAPYRDQLRGGRQSVIQALIANPNDIAGAQAMIDQQAAARKAVEMNVLSAASKALNVLNADQRAKLGSFVQDGIARRANYR